MAQTNHFNDLDVVLISFSICEIISKSLRKDLVQINKTSDLDIEWSPFPINEMMTDNK